MGLLNRPRRKASSYEGGAGGICAVSAGAPRATARTSFASHAAFLPSAFCPPRSTSRVCPSSATCTWASFRRFDMRCSRSLGRKTRSFDDFRAKKERNRAPALSEDLLLPVHVHVIVMPPALSALRDLFRVVGLLVLVLPASIRLRTMISRGMAERE